MPKYKFQNLIPQNITKILIRVQRIAKKDPILGVGVFVGVGVGGGRWGSFQHVVKFLLCIGTAKQSSFRERSNLGWG